MAAASVTMAGMSVAVSGVLVTMAGVSLTIAGLSDKRPTKISCRQALYIAQRCQRKSKIAVLLKRSFRWSLELVILYYQTIANHP